MCTAITYYNGDHYFGRNLDLEYSYRETVTVTPRRFPFPYRHLDTVSTHYALIGMATVANDYPLYYEAVNEQGLSMAGLNFPGNAVYYEPREELDNICPFELIPWILGQCKNLTEARALLKRINIIQEPFSPEYPLSPLHWILADQTGSMVIETLREGMRLSEDPVGVLTNNPPFDYHLQNLSNYLNVTAREPENRFSDRAPLQVYSRGMGGIGLPGDLSSASRFVRAAFTKLNARSDPTEAASVAQFFHILGTVSQTEGCVRINGHYEKTVYSCCCNMDKGIYYYTTYENSRVTGIRLTPKLCDGSALRLFPLRKAFSVLWEN